MSGSSVSFFSRFQAAAFLLLATGLFSAPVDAQEVLLAADFNDKALDQPIAVGGATEGEPVWVESTLDARVRDDVMPGKSLAIQWGTASTSAGTVRFNWLDGVEADTGVVKISFVFTLGEGGGYQILLREKNLSMKRFGGLRLTSAGSVWYDDAAGTTLLGPTWTPDHEYLLDWTFDLDAGTSDLAIDGIEYVTGRQFEVDLDGTGIGALLVGMLNSSDPASRFDIDDILVVWTAGDGIFADGFESDELPGQ